MIAGNAPVFNPAALSTDPAGAATAAWGADMLARSSHDREGTDMSRIAAARARLENARDLPGILDAAYDAFETMLAAIRGTEDHAAEGAFAAFVIAAAAAGNGRDAVAAAPSLPPAAPGITAGCEHPPAGGSTGQVALALARLAGLLGGKLTAAADLAAGPADRAASAEAAGYAKEIHSLLAGAQPE